MSAQVKLILTYISVALGVIGAFGPSLAPLAGLVPPNDIVVAGKVIAGAASLQLFISHILVQKELFALKLKFGVQEPKKSSSIPPVVTTLLGAFFLLVAGCLTPAQIAVVNADTAAANGILQSLAPVACAIADVTDPAQSVAICQVISNTATGATELVPVIGTLAALTQVVAVKPSNPAVEAAITTIKANHDIAKGCLKIVKVSP
jgi:hypothetical protein